MCAGQLDVFPYPCLARPEERKIYRPENIDLFPGLAERRAAVRGSKQDFDEMGHALFYEARSGERERTLLAIEEFQHFYHRDPSAELVVWFAAGGGRVRITWPPILGVRVEVQERTLTVGDRVWTLEELVAELRATEAMRERMAEGSKEG